MDLEATKRLLAKLSSAEEYLDSPSPSDYFFPGNLPLDVTKHGLLRLIEKDLEERLILALEKD